MQVEGVEIESLRAQVPRLNLVNPSTLDPETLTLNPKP